MRQARGSAASSWCGRQMRLLPPQPLHAPRCSLSPRTAGEGLPEDHGAGRDTPSGMLQAGARGLGLALETKPGRRGWEYFAFRGMEVNLQFSTENLSDRQGRPNTFLMQNLRSLCRMFSLDGLKGNTLIDVGCGPTIYQLLSACEHFQEIIALDYTDQNRQELEKWLKNEPGAFDWRPVVKYVCELEGDREKWAEKEEKLRKKVKQVLKCDVTKANPTDPVPLPPADCVISTLCLEAACKDLATFRSAVRNIGALVKPGGHLVMVTVLQETYYAFNKQVFSCLHLDRNVVEEAVEGAGFDVRFCEVQSYLPDNVCTDCKATLSLVARRRASNTE